MPLKRSKEQLQSKKTASKLELSDTDFATFGLEAEWREAFDWAYKNNIFEIFLLIFDTFCLGNQQKIAIGTIFKEFSSPYILQFLEEWQYENKLIAQLFHFCLKTKESLVELINHYPPLPHEISMDDEIQKGAKKYYLTMMIGNQVRHLPNENDKFWLSGLRIWLIIQAIQRKNNKDITHDNNLRAAARYLQEANFHDDVRLDICMALEKPLTQFSGNHVISFKMFSYLLRNRVIELKLTDKNPTNTRFFNALRKICEGKDSNDPVKSFVQNDLYKLAIQSFNFTPIGANDEFVPFYLQSKEEEYSNQYAEPLSEEEDANNSASSTPVNSEETYVLQKLKTKSVLLTHIELLNHLPWSWERLTESEQSNLDHWIDNNLKDHNDQNVLLAIYSWLAIHTARSLHRVLYFDIHNDFKNEWTLHPDGTVLRRIPPQRATPWKASTEAEVEWVYPSCEYNELRLPIKIKKPLKRLLGSVPKLLCLGDLWKHYGTSKEPFLCFNSAMKNELHRVSSSKLANILPQKVFDASRNATLARMIAFHPQTGLPGNCAYGNWSSLQVDQMMHLFENDGQDQKSTAEVIGIGSHLDPIEDLLIDAIKQATQQAQSKFNGDPIEYHNILVAYITSALLAATGARPLEDPFESPLFFNFEEGFVFIDDKNSDELHKGRLCPLPQSLNLYLKTTYTKHLHHISNALSQLNPDLSTEILKLANRNPSGNLPYFFFLSKDGMNWKSLSTKKSYETAFFDWPLPSNLFRQRFAKVLARKGLDNEIIDGFMGHVEKGMATWGDFSIRNWNTDRLASQTIIDSAYDQLEFELLPTWQTTPIIEKRFTSHEYQHQKIFGSKKRKQEQRRKIRNVIKETKIDIALFLGQDKQLADLSEDELEVLTKIIIFRDKGIIRRNWYVRYRTLNNALNKIYLKDGQKLVIKRRFMRFEQEKNPVSQLAPMAYSLYPILKVELQNILSAIDVSRLNRKDCLLLAAMQLIIENRISYKTFIKSILGSSHFRIVDENGLFHIEYSENLEPDNFNAAVQSHRISLKTARLLNRVLTAKTKVRIHDKKSLNIIQPVSKHLSSFFHNENYNAEMFLEKLCEVVDQVNIIEYPGVIAAFLSGRVTSCSLNWSDRIRLKTQKKLMTPTLSNNKSKKIKAQEENIGAVFEDEVQCRSSVMQTQDVELLQTKAFTAIKETSQILKQYKKSKPELTVSQLLKLIKQHDGKVSSSILLLLQWITDVVNQGKKQRDEAFADCSPDRYFQALAEKYSQVTYDTDLYTLDTDDITETYNLILKSLSSQKTNYGAKRLLSFHYWARSKSIEDPDWDELLLPLKTRSVSPGIITEQDYKKALELFNSFKQINLEIKLAAQFLLILCYRFGLRGMEGLGLKRNDWIGEFYPEYIIVNNNKQRKIKTKASKRTIPLLFELSNDEKKVIKEFMVNHEVIHDKKNTALFSMNKNDPFSVENIDLIKKWIIYILKSVTGNPAIVLHHARHSFANYIAVPLYQLNLSDWQQKKNISRTKPNMSEIILGKNFEISHRHTMAMARLLGHSHPKTGILSYKHFITHWADDLIAITRNRTKTELSQAYKISNMSPVADIDISLLEQSAPKYKATDFENLIKLLTLVSRGKSFRYGCDLLNLNYQQLQPMIKSIKACGNKMWLSKKNGYQPKVKEAPFEFLSRLNHDDWSRLLLFAKEKRNIPNKKELIAIDELQAIIGVRRQILMNKDVHFKTIRKLCNFLKLSEDFFTIVQVSPLNKFNEYAQKYSFQLLSMKESKLKTGKAFKADPLIFMIDEIETKQSDRCALSFKRNTEHVVQTSLELSVALITMVATAHLN